MRNKRGWEGSNRFFHRHADTLLCERDEGGVCWLLNHRHGPDVAYVWVVRGGKVLPWSVRRVQPFFWLHMPWQRAIEVFVSYLEKVQKESAQRAGKLSAEETRWVSAHPAIVEFCTATSYPDGSARKTSTLMVFAEDGVWKGCLNDRQRERSLWVTAGSPLSVFDALEACLQTGTGDWRQASYGKRKDQKR